MQHYLDGDTLVLEGLKRLDLESVQAILAVSREWEQQQNITKRLSDFQSVRSISIDFEDMWRIAKQRRIDRVSGYTAFVYSDLVTYGMLRMWMSLMDKGPLKMKVFDNRTAALAWLHDKSP